MDEQKVVTEKTPYNHQSSDVESISRSDKDGLPAYAEGNQGKLVRQLKNRHVAMIRCAVHAGLLNYRANEFFSIGGVIGTGQQSSLD